MTTLVVGATGATGRLVVGQLLDRGQQVKVIVRAPDRLPEHVRNHAKVTVIQTGILDLSEAELVQHVRGCEAVASCLGHNHTFKGIYGYPRRLVTEATHPLCEAVRASKPDELVKFVLRNTAG